MFNKARTTCITLAVCGSLLCCSPERSARFAQGQRQGEAPRALKEASGLTASVTNPGYLWALNDGGNPAEVFLLNEHADVEMTCRLRGIENRDWEALTLATGPDGVPHLYVGDVGDNESRYATKYIYRFPEPRLSAAKTRYIDGVTRLALRLPDGPRDVEAMTMDPRSGALYIISKREAHARVYRLDPPFRQEEVLVPTRVDTLAYRNVVAAAFSPDGSEFLLKTYNDILYWQIPSGMTPEGALRRAAETLLYRPEPQGETIAWKLDGSGFYTLSESEKGERVPLYFYRRNRVDSSSHR